MMLKRFRAKCVACKYEFRTPHDILEHPKLQVALCTRCFDCYNEPNWSYTDGSSDFCTLCAQGGQIVPCDNTHKPKNTYRGSKRCSCSFCTECLEYLMDKDAYEKLNHEIENDIDNPFICLICEPTRKTKKAQAKLKMMMEPSYLKKFPKVVVSSDSDETEMTEHSTPATSESSSADSQAEIPTTRKLPKRGMENGNLPKSKKIKLEKIESCEKISSTGSTRQLPISDDKSQKSQRNISKQKSTGIRRVHIRSILSLLFAIFFSKDFDAQSLNLFMYNRRLNGTVS